MTPQQVTDDYRAFVKAVQTRLPKSRIVFIAIKPSVKRWQLVDQMREANALIRKITTTDDRQVFVDVDTPMLGADGKPRKELFKEDGLHLKDAGYEIWKKCLLPHL